MVYHVANIVFDDADGDADIDVCTMPNNWLTQEAWRLAFTAWLQQQRAAMRALGHNDLGTWADFKVWLNSDMISDSDKPSLIDVNGNTFPTGSWDYSHFEIPNDGGAVPTKSDLKMMGLNNGTFPEYSETSLLYELEKALEIKQADPVLNSNSDLSVYGLLSADQPDEEVIQEVLDNIIEENELPPYSTTVVPGAGTSGSGRPSSPWVARTSMIKGGSSTSSPVTAVGGFAAPCGIIMSETNAGGDNSIGCTIELVPGEYKGVHAYPMRGGGY
jgi:hypothetical protein